MSDKELIQLRGEIMGRVLGLSVTGHYKTHDELMKAIDEMAQMVEQYHQMLSDWAQELREVA